MGMIAQTAGAAIVVTFVPASAFNANTAVMDAALGISGSIIEDFEDTTLINGLSIRLSGGVATTVWNSLPNLSNAATCGSNGIGAWDGTLAASNSVTNLIDNCAKPTGLASLTEFLYAPGTTSFGLALTNFQSLAAPAFAVTDHRLFVNGVDLGVIETLAGSNWSPGIVRNAYLRVDATGGDTITSVGIQNIAGTDYIAFDRLSVAGAASTEVPEPTTGISLVVAGAIVAGLKKRFGTQ